MVVVSGVGGPRGGFGGGKRLGKPRVYTGLYHLYARNSIIPGTFPILFRPLQLRLTSLHSIVINACARREYPDIFAYEPRPDLLSAKELVMMRDEQNATDRMGKMCAFQQNSEEAPRTGDSLASIHGFFLLHYIIIVYCFPVPHLGNFKT